MKDIAETEKLKTVVYGMLVEFHKPEPLIEAAKTAREGGFTELDAYSPYPMEELADAVGFKKDNVALVTLVGGIIGCLVAYGMQCFANVWDYPIDVAGRPDYSWPAFIPVTFELTVLGASLSAAIGMFFQNKLPKYWHPVFNAPEFARASRDRFFLCLSAEDPMYDPDTIRGLLEKFKPLGYREVTYDE